MLARIRRALGRGPAPVAPEELPPFTSGGARAEEGDAVGLFRERVVSAGGRVRDVRTAKEVAEYLGGLLPREASAKVAVSEGAERAASGLRAILTSAGFAVLPTLREYKTGGEGSTGQYVRELLAAWPESQARGTHSPRPARSSSTPRTNAPARFAPPARTRLHREAVGDSRRPRKSLRVGRGARGRAHGVDARHRPEPHGGHRTDLDHRSARPRRVARPALRRGFLNVFIKSGSATSMLGGAGGVSF